MLIVTGASGKLGRMIVDALMQHVPANQIGVSVRDPAKVAELSRHGVRVMQGDFKDADSLRRAWNGAERLLLVSSNAAAIGGDPLKQHATAIDVARELGIGRVLYTSQVSSSPDSLFPPGRDHAATETMLERSGLRWTALRHGFYAESAVAMNAKGFDSGVLETPVDGKVAWTTHEDLAAVDAILLVGLATVDGPTAPLTGSEALDLTDLARLAGEVTGRPVGRRVIDEDEMAANARRAGVPDGSIAVMLGYFRAARAGEFSTVDATLSNAFGSTATECAERVGTAFRSGRSLTSRVSHRQHSPGSIPTVDALRYRR